MEDVEQEKAWARDIEMAEEWEEEWVVEWVVEWEEEWVVEEAWEEEVKYHNRPSLPREETETCLFYSGLIRDALPELPEIDEIFDSIYSSLYSYFH